MDRNSFVSLFHTFVKWNETSIMINRSQIHLSSLVEIMLEIWLKIGTLWPKSQLLRIIIWINWTWLQQQHWNDQNKTKWELVKITEWIWVTKHISETRSVWYLQRQHLQSFPKNLLWIKGIFQVFDCSQHETKITFSC